MGEQAVFCNVHGRAAQDYLLTTCLFACLWCVVVVHDMCAFDVGRTVVCARDRLKQISSDLSKQYELLRLIVQKMEIRTEQENVDDDYPRDDEPPSRGRSAALRGIGWSSRALRHNLLKQSAVISKWSKSTDSRK